MSNAKVIHRIEMSEGTEIRVYDTGSTFNVLVYDNDANEALPFAYRCKTAEAAIAKAVALSTPRSVSISI